MSLAALTAAQEHAVQALVAQGRLRVVPPDAQRAAKFLEIADERLAELGLLGSAVVRHGVAYDAAHDVGQALLAAHGYATTGGTGQHAVVGDFMTVVIDAPPDDARAASAFDQARRSRNSQNYRGTSVGAHQADAVERIARALRHAVSARGVGQ